MFIRIIQVGIVVFWAATTGWLIQTIWFPGGLSSDRSVTRETLDRFFAWNETNDLVIFENGERIGMMTISGSSGIDRDTGKFTREFSTAGSIRSQGAAELEGLMGSSWRMSAEFDEDYEMTTGLLTFRMPSQGLRVSLEIEGDPAILDVSAEQNGLPLFQTRRPLGGEADPAAELPPGILPIGISPADLESWRPRFQAGKTTIDVAGRKLPVYQLHIGLGNENAIRIFLSEAGGPLRIETDWAHEAVAEAILPVEP